MKTTRPDKSRSGCVIAAVAVMLLLAFAFFVIPSFFGMSFRAKRVEAPANVTEIRGVQLSYMAAFDTYVSCGSREEAERALSSGNPKAQRHWEGGEGWEELGWRPDGKVRGAYWVEVNPAGDRFEVWGIIDIDGDGERAVFRATDREETVMVTEDAW